MSEPVLYGYWRSSAAYRVRIALNLKGIACRQASVHLVRDGGEQHAARYRELNPQGLVPTFVDGEAVVTQSIAILEYLEETVPAPALLPAGAAQRARVRALSLIVACDIHPLQNLRVLNTLRDRHGVDDEARADWVRYWITEGLRAFEAMLAHSPDTGVFCHGDTPGFADVCLVPQIYNAVRWGCDPGDFPTIRRINGACLELDSFRRAAPEAQPDAA